MHEVRRLLRNLGLLVAATALLVLSSTALGQAHDTSILGCTNNVRYEKAVRLSEQVLPNGLLAEFYDTNDDGAFDIIAMSYIMGVTREVQGDTEVIEIEHHPHPILYVVDLDYDTIMDAVYVDKSEGGDCDGIVLYEDLRTPRNLDSNIRKSDGNV